MFWQLYECFACLTYCTQSRRLEHTIYCLPVVVHWVQYKLRLGLSAAPDQEACGAQLTGFARHVSYYTEARGSNVRRSGRLPIQSFANTTFPDASNGAPSWEPSCFVVTLSCCGACSLQTHGLAFR